jgi:mannose-6-phosphate isomerase-like protein (cupin superfamily)
LASGLQRKDRNSGSASRKKNKMIESTKVSSPVEQLAVSRKAAVHDDDTSLGTLAYLNAKGKTGAHRCVSSATLCFIRGTGRIAINNTSLAYHDGKWFEVPSGTTYRIFPDTDTVMLTIQKSTGTSVDAREERFLRRLNSTFGRSSRRKA